MTVGHPPVPDFIVSGTLCFDDRSHPPQGVLPIGVGRIKRLFGESNGTPALHNALRRALPHPRTVLLIDVELILKEAPLL